MIGGVSTHSNAESKRPTSCDWGARAVNYREHFEPLGGLLPVVGTEFVPLTESELSQVEAFKGARLPDDFRKFLCEFGGVSFGEILMVRPIKPLPKGVSTSGNVILSMLYGSENHRELYSLIRNCRHLASALPSKFIPIGDDGGGAKICLSLSVDELGHIYYWDNRHIAPLDFHGQPRDSGDNLKVIYPIANSFTDMLHRLFVLE